MKILLIAIIIVLIGFMVIACVCLLDKIDEWQWRRHFCRPGAKCRLYWGFDVELFEGVIQTMDARKLTIKIPTRLGDSIVSRSINDVYPPENWK